MQNTVHLVLCWASNFPCELWSVFCLAARCSLTPPMLGGVDGGDATLVAWRRREGVVLGWE